MCRHKGFASILYTCSRGIYRTRPVPAGRIQVGYAFQWLGRVRVYPVESLLWVRIYPVLSVYRREAFGLQCHRYIIHIHLTVNLAPTKILTTVD